MKIIKNNYKNNNSVHRVICDCCDSELEITNDDITVNEFGDSIIKCPVCGEEVWVTPDVKELTIRNLVYPDDFYSFEDGVDIPSDTINKWIKICYDKIKYDDDNNFYYIASGNTFVFLHKMKEEIYIMVAKNYKDTTIDKE